MENRELTHGRIETSSRRQRLFYAVILGSGFLATLGVGLFSFTLPLLSLDAKVSGAWLGSAFAGYFLARLIAAPLSGVLADRIGPRVVLLTAALLGAVIPFIWFVLPYLSTLYVIQFFLGLVSGLFKPVGMAVLGNHASRERLSFWYAWHALAFNLAIMVGPLLGGWLYLGRDIGPVLLAVSACMGAAALLIGVGLPRTASTCTPERAATDGEQTSIFDRVFLYMAIACRSLGIGLVVAFYPILLATVLGKNGAVLGAVFSVPSLLVCLGLPVFGSLLGNRSKVTASVIGMLISAGALFALGACRELWQFVVFGGLMGLGSAISIPSSMALASTLDRRQGRAFGLAHGAAGIGFILGPLLGGLVVQNFHGVGHALQVAAVIGACGCMPLLYCAIREQFDWSRPVAVAVSGGCLFLLAVMGGVHSGPQQSEADGLYHYSDVAMGTVVKLTLAADSRTAADTAADRAINAMRLWQKDFDYRDPNGSVGRINQAAGKRWVKPSGRAFDLLERTLAFSEQTGGVFDPTIGALTASPLYYVLDGTMARERKKFVGYRMVQVDASGRRVRLEKQGMALDMGGVAKGAIIDMTVKLLRKQGIAAGIVEAGGDFYCFGDREWTVGVRHPRDHGVYASLKVREKGVCGSGDYEQFVTTKKGGEPIIQHHIIDPSDMASADESTGVTVVADSAERADNLATALFIMGPVKGLAFMQTHYPEAAGMWFAPDLSMTATHNFPQ